jgi:hypothetical protein
MLRQCAATHLCDAELLHRHAHGHRGLRRPLRCPRHRRLPLLPQARGQSTICRTPLAPNPAAGKPCTHRRASRYGGKGNRRHSYQPSSVNPLLEVSSLERTGRRTLAKPLTLGGGDGGGGGGRARTRRSLQARVSGSTSGSSSIRSHTRRKCMLLWLRFSAKDPL